MTGRGIDQIMAQPCAPHIHESVCKSALDYVALAERASGPIPRGVPPNYVWGDALEELSYQHSDARVINLETALTVSEDAWPGKGIHYRMSPLNGSCLAELGVHCCSLANNHILDWGYKGLEETLSTLRNLKILPVGAGSNASEAAAPAIIPLSEGRRVLIFAWGSGSAGVPSKWRATSHTPGVNLLPNLLHSTVKEIALHVHHFKRPRDVVIASIHWGGNWEYHVSSEQQTFAHRLIDEAGIDVLHGHAARWDTRRPDCR